MFQHFPNFTRGFFGLKRAFRAKNDEVNEVREFFKLARRCVLALAMSRTFDRLFNRSLPKSFGGLKSRRRGGRREGDSLSSPGLESAESLNPSSDRLTDQSYIQAIGQSVNGIERVRFVKVIWSLSVFGAAVTPPMTNC